MSTDRITSYNVCYTKLLRAPTALVLGLFFFWPLALVFKNSLYRWDMLTAPEWAGLANYEKILASGELLSTGLRIV